MKKGRKADIQAHAESPRRKVSNGFVNRAIDENNGAGQFKGQLMKYENINPMTDEERITMKIELYEKYKTERWQNRVGCRHF